MKNKELINSSMIALIEESQIIREQTCKLFQVDASVNAQCISDMEVAIAKIRNHYERIEALKEAMREEAA